ncbi:MAG: DUF4956 domain-containing protein [Bacilli bacterium]|nr:DUF4956 domain-containing protein [Bacilli bacterium]
MSFVDVFKRSFIEQFTGTISVQSIILSLGTAFIISVFILFVYKKTYTGVVYSKSFSLSILLLALVTTLIIQTISSNITLSLGMVGALSIVRFRTAVKEPVDTGFMFWAITAGIMAGANLYIAAIVGSLIVGLLYFICYSFGLRMGNKYLVIIKYKDSAADKVEKELSNLVKYKVKSRSISNGIIEYSFEIELSDESQKLIDKISSISGVENTNIVSYQNDFGV